MIGRHNYRRPRFRPFKPSLLASAPVLMLTIGFVISAGAHVGLGYAMKDRPIGLFDPDALAEQDVPVRVKRARFDEVLTPDLGEGVGQEDQTAESLAESLMDDVQTMSAETFDPDLELRKVQEPIARPAAPTPTSTAGIDFDELLGSAFDEPDELAFDTPTPYDTSTATGPGSAELAGDLLSELTAPGGGLPSIGEVGGGTGAGPAGSGGAAGVEPGVGSAVVGMGSTRGSTGGTGGGLGMDFMDFGALDPADFEPPERLDDDFEYEVARFNPANDEGYFRVRVTGKRSLRKLETMPKDVIFMVDTSRSIPERTIREVARGIQESIRTLNDDDRFNMVFFNQSVSFYADAPVHATPKNVEIADKWLRSVKPRGSTDVNLAVRQLLKRDLDPGRVYELVLISDGKPTMGVLDTRELINLITRENDLAASIYCIGLGKSADHQLLDFLAYRNKGFSVHIERTNDVAEQIRGLMSRLRYPIISDVQVRFAGSDMSEVYPITLPNIHQGESFEVFGRFEQPGPFTMQITGRSVGKPVDFTYRAELNEADFGNTEVAQGWAFWKLHHLYSEIIRVGERDVLLRQIRELRQKYNLETLY